MSKFNTTFTAIVILLVYSLSPSQSIGAQVWLLAGQSNMIGYGTNSADLPPSLQQPQTNVKIFTDAGTGWTDLAPGLGPSSASFGPELTFGHDIAATFPGEEVYLIKARFGLGDLYNNWRSPNTGRDVAGEHYSNFVALQQAAMASLPDAEIAGMIWMQGEGDGCDDLTEATSYESNLRLFIDSIRTDLNLPDLRFVIGKISESSAWTYGQYIRDAQETVAQSTPNCEIVVTNDLPFCSDGMHYSSAGSMELGSRFAKAAAGSAASNETVAVVPDTVTVINNSPFALGWSFTVNEEISVTSLGAFDIAGNGPADGQLARIYDATNDTILVEAEIDGTATVETCSGYDVYYQSIAPLTLTPGVEYIVAVSQGLAGDIMNSTSLITKGSEIDPICGRATAYPSPIDLNGNLPDSVNDFSIANSNPLDLYLGAQFKYSSVAHIAGDANDDGKVDGSDVTILAGNWQYGVTDGGATWSMGDFNSDGKVDGSDVTILAGNWQYSVSTSAASAVPEPLTSSLLSMALLSAVVALFHRRAK